MKKFVLILLAAASCFIISCSSKDSGGMSETAKNNLTSFHTVSDAFMSGDISKIDDVVASDFIDHTERGDMGRDSLKAMIAMMNKKQNDMKTEIKKEFADDEYVMAWMRWTGTSDGSMGMPAGPYDMSGIELVKYKDGKATEHWAFMEVREMMKMMAGAQQMPSAPTETKKDTANMMKK